MTIAAAGMAQKTTINSRLEVYALEFSQRMVIYEEDAHFEAPNWSNDGQYFIINQDGLLYKISLDGSTKTLIQTSPLEQCNNDHGISSDGKLLAISNNDSLMPNTHGTSRIYTLPLDGGTPKLITPLWPSYWHGWSPDGETMVYTAFRDGDFDIYSMRIKEGEEKRLTSASGLDDGPDYAPDGKTIYYNSFQSGRMEIWRMNSDGNQKTQLTDDPYSNWFPHPSPDGSQLVFLSYLEDQGDRHPPMKEVVLRLMDIKTKNIRTICKFTGGQGTINVPSWSPDGSKLAFVSYRTKNP
jgi:Tol biopolymer transport system component